MKMMMKMNGCERLLKVVYGARCF